VHIGLGKHCRWQSMAFKGGGGSHCHEQFMKKIVIKSAINGVKLKRTANKDDLGSICKKQEMQRTAKH